MSSSKPQHRESLCNNANNINVNNKRSSHAFSDQQQQQRQEEEEDPITDDLTIAAAFAVATPPLVVMTKDSYQNNNNNNGEYQEDKDDKDSNEIDLEEQESSSASSRKSDEEQVKNNANVQYDFAGKGHELVTANTVRQMEETCNNNGDGEKSNNINNSKNDDDDDDDDVDLTEELKQMRETLAEEEEEIGNDDDDGDDDDDGNLISKAAAVAASQSVDNNKTTNEAMPMTTHEIDAYGPATDLADLESLIGKDFSTPMTIAANFFEPKQINASQLALAGHVQHHMVEDRIIVVQSQTASLLVLEEGNLLVFKMQEEEEVEINKNERGGRQVMVYPLGKVFEVFGPVSQPLYSIRLPPLPVSPENQHNKEKDSDNTVENEKLQSTNDPLHDKEQVGGSQKTRPGDDEHDGNVTAPGSASASQNHVVDDPWSLTGVYTMRLQRQRQRPQARGVAVYYVHDQNASFIDTHRVYHDSRKAACDASNMHDEEVVNPNEMDYSDDEQERQAKQRGRNKHTGGRGEEGRVNISRASSNQPHFNSQQQQHLSHPQYYPTAPLTVSQGFHRPSPQQQQSYIHNQHGQQHQRGKYGQPHLTYLPHTATAEPFPFQQQQQYNFPPSSTHYSYMQQSYGISSSGSSGSVAFGHPTPAPAPLQPFYAPQQQQQPSAWSLSVPYPHQSLYQQQGPLPMLQPPGQSKQESDTIYYD